MVKSWITGGAGFIGSHLARQSQEFDNIEITEELSKRWNLLQKSTVTA